MNLLNKEFDFEDLRRWGALEIYSEPQVREWFGAREQISIGDALAMARIRPSILFWAVLRPELVDEPLLHGLAVDLAEALLARLRAAGHYIDFRSERVLARKRAWVSRQITLGELSVARHRAQQARMDVSEIEDPAVWAGAKAAVQASQTDGRTAVTDVYYTALEFDGSSSHQRAILRGVRDSLRDSQDHWTMAGPGAIHVPGG